MAPGAGMPRHEVEVDGRRLTLSNLDKILYPAAGFTKAGVIDYYRRVAPVLLPHLAGRHVTLRRFPDGVDGESFFEKNCPGHRPPWVRTAVVRGRSRDESVEHCLVDDLPTLVWLANLAALELHVPMATADRPDHPTGLVFDLDPGPPTGVDRCAAVALLLRDVLAGIGLESFPKTSGQKGVHVYVPLGRPVSIDREPTAHRPDQEQARAFAHAVAEVVARRSDGEVVTKMDKQLRSGRVFIDWSQNARHKTTVGVYSLRATAEPSVSTPLRWEEVETAVGGPADGLRFGPAQVVDRVSTHGDLFSPVVDLAQDLPDFG